MCSSRISNLTPEASLHGQQEQEVVKVLEDVRRYNHVFVGGVRGLARVSLSNNHLGGFCLVLFVTRCLAKFDGDTSIDLVINMMACC
jgi:hypothetical protein